MPQIITQALVNPHHKKTRLHLCKRGESLEEAQGRKPFAGRGLWGWFMVSGQSDISASFRPTLEVRAGKTANRFAAVVYLVALIGLPWLGWLSFGPGTPGDTTVNGNSILANWFMCALLFGGWVCCIIGLKRCLDLLKHLPILFTLDELGIKDRSWNITAWTEIETIYYIEQDLHLKLSSRSKAKFIKIKTEELGFKSMDEIDSFIRKYAPTHLTKDL